MIAFFFFVGTFIILTVVGRMMLLMSASQNLSNAELWSLGFPVGAFLNALLFFLLTVLHLPLSTVVVFLFCLDVIEFT